MNGGFVMPFREDRMSIIRILRFTKTLLAHLINRMPQEEQRIHPGNYTVDGLGAELRG
jgi:hypothetical protein